MLHALHASKFQGNEQLGKIPPIHNKSDLQKTLIVK